MSISIRDIFKNPEDFLDKEIVLSGWIKTSRASKNFGFIELTDGTAFKPIQVVYGKDLSNFDEVEKYPISSSLEVTGKLLNRQGKINLSNFKQIKLLPFVHLILLILFKRRDTQWNI